ncbi:hypothetical protein C8J57DRAFT_106689 [Mycena rebaudengoi]|nr:hypothetical protein C8J57DRAFT_106689 [Mycena rebaudengoi]
MLAFRVSLFFYFASSLSIACALALCANDYLPPFFHILPRHRQRHAAPDLLLQDRGRRIWPSSLPELASLDIAPALLEKGNFRRVVLGRVLGVLLCCDWCPSVPASSDLASIARSGCLLSLTIHPTSGGVLRCCLVLRPDSTTFCAPLPSFRSLRSLSLCPSAPSIP